MAVHEKYVGILVTDESSFSASAIHVFKYQAKNNAVYAEWLRLMGVDPSSIYNVESIPFIPIGFYKTRKILADAHTAEKTFSSSGTTEQAPARHYVADLGLYRESLLQGFQRFWGSLGQYSIYALLPGYAERPDASLVYMVDELGKQAKHFGGYYLRDYKALVEALANDVNPNKLLFGVTHALVDLASAFPGALKGVTIIETGGMKGRGREMVRDELYGHLCQTLQPKAIASEYGMTELLSQAWKMPGDAYFQTPPWMRVMVRDPHDPLELLPPGRNGVLNIIDLANIYSCSFLATDDLGAVYEDGSFNVIGRADNSDIRGCSLMAI